MDAPTVMTDLRLLVVLFGLLGLLLGILVGLALRVDDERAEDKKPDGALLAELEALRATLRLSAEAWQARREMADQAAASSPPPKLG